MKDDHKRSTGIRAWGCVAACLLTLLTAGEVRSGGSLAGATRNGSIDPYPQAVQVGGDLDIVVTRDGRQIVLTNRTAHRYRQATLWLNQQYCGQVDALPIGKTVRLPLDHFVNAHGEPFPIGGFLTPEKTRPLVLAELYEPASSDMNLKTVQQSGETGSASRRYRLLTRR